MPHEKPMKQHIDLEQLLELRTDFIIDVVDQVRIWQDLDLPIQMIFSLKAELDNIKKDPSYTHAIKGVLVTTAKEMTIGRMFELLSENCENFYTRTNHKTWFVLADQHPINGNCLCDALWETIKKVYLPMLERSESHKPIKTEPPKSYDIVPEIVDIAIVQPAAPLPEQNEMADQKDTIAQPKTPVFIEDADENEIKEIYEVKKRIVIERCSFPEAWYATRINQEFRAAGEDEMYYFVRFQGTYKRVLKTNAKPLVKKNNLG